MTPVVEAVDVPRDDVLVVRDEEHGEQLDTEGVAKLLGISAASVRRYMVADRGKYGFPEPDGRLGRSPWWWESTILAWQAARPGKGAGAGRPRKDAAPAKKATVKEPLARRARKSKR